MSFNGIVINGKSVFFIKVWSRRLEEGKLFMVIRGYEVFKFL